MNVLSDKEDCASQKRSNTFKETCFRSANQQQRPCLLFTHLLGSLAKSKTRSSPGSCMTCVPHTRCNYIIDIHRITGKPGYSLIYQPTTLLSQGISIPKTPRCWCYRTGTQMVVFLKSVCKLNIDFLTVVDFDLTRVSRGSKQRLPWDVVKKKKSERAAVL